MDPTAIEKSDKGNYAAFKAKELLKNVAASATKQLPISNSYLEPLIGGLLIGQGIWEDKPERTAAGLTVIAIGILRNMKTNEE